MLLVGQRIGVFVFIEKDTAGPACGARVRTLSLSLSLAIVFVGVN